MSKSESEGPGMPGGCQDDACPASLGEEKLGLRGPSDHDVDLLHTAALWSTNDPLVKYP